MEFVTTRDFKIKSNMYLNKKSDIVITKYGKPVAMLIPISENSIEDIYLKISGILKKSRISKKDVIKALDEIRSEVYA